MISSVKSIRKIPNRKAWIKPIKSEANNYLDSASDDEKKKLVGYLNDCYTQSRDWRETYKQHWLRYYLLYRNYSQFYDSRPKWQASYMMPKAFEFVETILPRMMSSLYDTSPLWAAIPQSEEMRKASHLVELLLDTRVWQTRMYETHYNLFKEVLIYGTGFLKMTYQDTSEYEGCKWDNVDLFDVFPEPMGATLAAKRYVMDRRVIHYETLKEMEDFGTIKGLSQLGKMWKGAENTAYNFFSELDRVRTIGMGGIEDMSKRGYHEVQEYWGTYTNDETGETDDIVATVIDRDFLVRWETCPYYYQEKKNGFYYAKKPYVMFRDVQLSGETYGIGEIEVIESMIYENNDTRNMVIDAMQFALSPVFQVFRNGMVDPEAPIIFAPGETIDMNVPGAGAVTPVQTSTNFMAGYTQGDRTVQDMRDALGIHQPLSGAEGQIRKTATEIVSLIQEANQRVKMKIQLAEITSLSDQARMTYLCEKQYTDTEVMAQVFDNQEVKAFAKISPMKLKWQGDFRLQASGLYGQKGVIANQRLQFLDTLQAVPPEAQALINYPKLIRLIAESMEIRDKDIILEPKPEPKVEAPASPPNLALLQGGAGMPPPMPTGMPDTGTQLPSLGAPPVDLLQQIQASAAANAPIMG